MNLLNFAQHKAIQADQSASRPNDEFEHVVLLHGLFGNLDNLSVIRRYLTQYYNVISIDLPDHGLSPRTDNFSFDTYAKKVANTLAHLKVTKVHIVAHSLGGKVAMYIARLFPGLIAKLIVLDIAPVAYNPRHENVMRGLQAVELNKINNRKDAHKMLAKYIVDTGTQAFLLKGLYQRNKTWAWRFNLDLISRDYNILSDWQLNNDLVFDGAVLFIKGAKSDYITAQHQSTIMAQFPNAQAKIVDAGHWLHAEKPQVVNMLITRFLRGA